MGFDYFEFRPVCKLYRRTSWIYTTNDRKGKVFKNIIIFSVFINVALNFILVPFYGIIGASLSSLFSLLISSICSLYIIYKDYNVKSFYLPFCNESNSDV